MPPSDFDSDDSAHTRERRADSGHGSRCGGCGQTATRTRRGLCHACYARWVRARPVGLGASCACCNDRRMVHLRHFELRGLWVVLCHNCCARAERMTPAARSVDQLLAGIRRQRRSSPMGDRRAPGGFDFGDHERRVSGRRAEDQVDPAREAGRSADAGQPVVELVSEYPLPGELRDGSGEPITAVHALLDPAER